MSALNLPGLGLLAKVHIWKHFTRSRLVKGENQGLSINFKGECNGVRFLLVLDTAK